MEFDVVLGLGRIVAGTSKSFSFTIQENLTPFVPTNLFITIYDEATGQIVNTKNEFELTPVGDYVNVSGLATVPLSPADNTLLNTLLKPVAEVHRIRMRWTWSGGTKVGKGLAYLTVEPQDKERDAA